MIIIKHRSALIKYYQDRAGTGVSLTAAFALLGQNTHGAALCPWSVLSFQEARLELTFKSSQFLNSH